MTPVPTIGALAPCGPNPAKVRFFLEVAAGLEFLALFYALPTERQAELLALVRSYSAAAAGDSSPSQSTNKGENQRQGPKR